ncbi:sulfoxide reductase heme-binding subunit YedZ [Ahniella affigens]|uniref:Protein-methionine-sulfoxide reductase heme-binding subunit MsrQ n=1 Tax=Ahniella affigens TaxID=2021234 RepID=A0A2P1PN40_9GAMM|nr:sulfoxide reductase heme-binding subunit YedZ [Ahniella affigens]
MNATATKRWDRIAWSKWLLFPAALLPALLLLQGALQNTLGADPVKALTHATGLWALRFLLLSLAMTPFRLWTGWTGFIRYRRMLGLYAFFYACLHLLVYLVLDLGTYWADLLTDIQKRPYMTVGFGAWLIMLPLAITSTRGMIRRMGRHWQRLHRLVYVAGILAALHFLWLVKADLREPGIYAGILAVLLLARLWPKRRARGTGPVGAATTSRK